MFSSVFRSSLRFRKAEAFWLVGYSLLLLEPGLILLTGESTSDRSVRVRAMGSLSDPDSGRVRKADKAEQKVKFWFLEEDSLF